MEIHTKYWFGDQETSISGEGIVLEELEVVSSSRKKRSRHNQFRFPKTSHIPSRPFTGLPEATVKSSTHNSRSKKTVKTSQFCRVEEDETTVHKTSNVSPNFQTPELYSTFNMQDFDMIGKDQPSSLDISCCCIAAAGRDFWSGFEKGFHDAYVDAYKTGRCSSCTPVECASCELCLNEGQT